MYYSFYIWVGDRMDLKQLQYFATVAKEGNISKAAQYPVKAFRGRAWLRAVRAWCEGG